MAEFALGLTKTAVEGTLSRVKSAIEEEGKQRERVQEDLVFITGEFQMMQAFLNASSAGERASKNLVVREWVRQLRDLAFDVENCVEFVVHLDKPSPWDWVQRLASSLPCVARPPLPLDVAVAEIKRLKARVEEVSQRNTRYNLMAGGGDNVDENQHQQLLIRPAGGHTSAPGAEAFHVLRDVWKAIGKLPDTTGDLKRLIDCQGSELKVISLWGSTHFDVAGELGWEGIVKTAYDDPEICQEFKNRAWVKVPHPFNPVKFLNNLLTQLTSHLQPCHHHRHHNDMSMLLVQLSKHKYLIVLEKELSSFADWDAIRVCLPDGNNGSRIIISTKHLGIARVCTGKPFEVWDLQHNSHDRYLCALFPKHIHVQSNPEDEEEFDLDKLTVPDSFETCRKFLTEHDYLIYVEDTLHFPMQWELIKQHIVCESTRARVVVATCNPSVAKHGVDYQHRALNTEDLLSKGCDQQDKSGHAKKKQVKEEGWLVGRDAEVDLFRGFNRGVVSVWGIAGIGKSAIVREIYDTGKLDTEDKMYGWVDVPHPFSLTDMCRRLFLEFYSDDADAMERTAIGMIEDQDLIRRCCKILRERKCLLVIDGLRSTHDWDLIRSTLLSQANIGGQTIVITHEESIANHCTNREEGRTLNVKGLDADMALGLFRKITLDNKELSAHPLEANMISRLISSKCGGLPKVIVAMGKHISTFGCERLGSIDAADFMGCLQNNSDFPSLTSLFCWMKSYFHTCPDELKPCIFYVSIFPAEQSIRPSRLLRRFIAEGYSSGGGGTEEKGESLLSELMKLSILYQDMKGSSTIRSYRVNGFFHEYIKSQPMEDNLVFALEGSCSPSSRLAGQHLTISSSWDRDEIVFNSMDLSRLRSLTVFGKWVSFLVSDKMKVLRVLDLEGTSSTPDGIASVTDDVLEKIVKQFPRLKFMSLRGCMEVTRLPDSLGAMSQLETLDARHTSIVELPPAVITRLHKLQYIRAGTTEARRLQQAAAVAAAAEVAAAEAAVAAPTPPSSPPPTTTTQEDVVHSGTSPFLVGAKAAALRAVQRGSTRVTGAWKRRAHALVESKKQRRRRVRVAANGGGVEVGRAAAEGIGKLTGLHTLGVVNIAGGIGGLALLKELKNLTQLRKLGLSGINRENWKDLCSAISGHLPHLESLSLQLLLLEEDGGSYEFACFDDICVPRKTLKILKVLYTSSPESVACIRQTWIRLPNTFKHEWRVSSGEDIGMLFSQSSVCCPLLKPVEELLSFGHLPVPDGSKWTPLEHLRFDCHSNRSSIIFGGATFFSVETLDIHTCVLCNGSSCMQIDGLRYLHGLKRVCVTGGLNSGFEQYLRKQLDQHANKPELKLITPLSDQW